MLTLADEANQIQGVGTSEDLANLVVVLGSGQTLRIDAERLRLACKCAHCLRARLDGRFPDSFPGIAIVEVTGMGYGINVSFSDGHARGIYPKAYLAELLQVTTTL